MSELQTHIAPPAPTLDRETPQRMRAFVGGHKPLFILVATLLAQLVCLSYQINRNTNGRLIKGWTVALFHPFQRTLQTTADATTWAWSSLHGLWHAQQENRELRAAAAEDQARIRELSEKAAEDDRLRSLLDLRNHLPFQTVAAEVIAASPAEGSSAIVIDKGADAGLSTDLAVLTPLGVVGKTIAVFPHTAQVLLITDQASGVGALLADTRVQGVLKGAGRNFCQLHYVMNEEPVALKSEVLTSGLDQIYPRGLLLGRVVKVEEGNIYKTILVQPAAALDRLESVLVALKLPANQPSTPNPSPQD